MDKVHAKAQGSQPGHTLKPVLGPLSMRDALVVFGGVLVIVGSLVPIPWTKAVSVNMWIFPGLPFHLFVSLLLPLGIAAAFLWRRLTGRTRVRVASLSLDQAGSVVALFAAAYFFNSYVASMSPAYLIGLLGALAMIVGTTLASYLGFFRHDFVPGGDSVLGADVYPVAQTPKDAAAKDSRDPATPAADSGSEGFGASSARNATAGRPGTPVTSKPEERRESAPASSSDASTDISAGASAGAAAAAAGVAAAATGPAPVKSDAAQDQSFGPAAAQRREPALEVASSAEGKGGEQDALAPQATKAPHPERAEAPSPKQANGQPDHGNQDPTDTAHPPTDVKSVAADKADSSSDSGSEVAAEQRADAEAANAQERPSGSTEAEPSRPAPASKSEDAAKPELDRAGPVDAAAKPGQDSKFEVTEAARSAALATDAEAQDSAHPATMATPRAGTDIKATAALSRVDIAAHQAAVERAKAEAESSFGAKADGHEHDGQDEAAASFWFALNHPRPVFHPAHGTMLSTLKPGTWILCLEDRGTEYLISLADDRQAVLRNLDDLQFPEK